MKNRMILEPDWRDRIKLGDVLYEGGDPNKPRIVRHVSRRKRGPNEGLLSSVVFSILHCSWTGRAYTTVDRPALKQRGFTPAHVRITTMTRMDKRLHACIINPDNWQLTCCDVKGLR